jgi:DNA modification methylase
MSRVEHIGDATLYLGDCREILPTLPKVDAVVTSPPYGQQRDYGQKINDWRSLVSTAATLTPEHEQTQVLINLGLIHRDGRVIRYWNDLIDDMEAHGWRLFGWYVWDQGDGLPGDWNGRLAPSHEFVFHFNRVARQINKWVPTKSFGRKITGTGMRKRDGCTSERMSGDGDAVGQSKIADSVIRVYREMHRDVDHPAIFPVNLPIHLLKSFSLTHETVCDFFMGSGTTGVACAKLGRKFIGIEIEPKYFDIACRRIEAAYKQPDLFIEKPKPATQEVML